MLDGTARSAVESWFSHTVSPAVKASTEDQYLSSSGRVVCNLLPIVATFHHFWNIFVFVGEVGLDL